MGPQTILLVTGHGLGASYRAFALAKMTTLSLDGRVEVSGEGLRLCVRGEEALVDMLEIACLLGPADCIVERIERVEGSEEHG